jgi:hypothetical protein
MTGSISENHFMKALSAAVISSGCPPWFENVCFSAF